MSVQRDIQVQICARRRLVHPIPALVVHPALLSSWGVRPVHAAEVRVGERSAVVWLVAATGRHEELFDKRHRRTTDVYVDWRTAQALGLADASRSEGGVRFATATLTVQPQRHDDRLATDEVIVSSSVLDQLGGRHSPLLVSSGSRKMAVRARESGTGTPQDPAMVRLNFHARLLLGLERSEDGERPSVVVSQLTSAVRKRPRASVRVVNAIRAGVWTVLFRTGEFLLRAPRVAVAITSSASADDDAGVVRLSPAVMDLIGVHNGDSVVVSWAGRTAATRAYVDVGERVDIGRIEVVDWTQSSADQNRLASEFHVSLPSGIRNSLGAPRDAVVVVRRSLSGLFRRRLIALAIPLVGVAVSVAQLGLDVWVGAGLFAASVFLTMAGDRIGRARVRPSAQPLPWTR